MRTSTRTTLAATAALTLALGLGTAATADRDDRTDRDLEAVGLLASGTELVTFDVDEPRQTSNPRALTGLGGETLVGIDYRVQDGALYGVGNMGGIFRITGSTAEKVGQITGLSGTAFGVDFNPAANALRVVSDTGQNLRISFASGVPGPTIMDGRLNNGGAAARPTGADASAPFVTSGPVVTGVTAAAYTNNDLQPVTGTALFDLDTDEPNGADKVLLQSPANTGALVASGDLGQDSGPAGFDVYSTLRGGKTVANQGYAVLTGTSNRLAKVDVLTGEALVVGSFDKAVVDLALPLDQREDDRDDD